MKKGEMNTWEIIGTILLTLFLLGVLFTPLGAQVRGFFSSADEATSCSTSLAEGVCMETCEEGFVNVPGTGCPFVCCVAQSAEAEELKEQILTFSNAIRNLNQCASNKDNSYCNVAYRNIIRLVNDDRMKITFTRQGEQTWVRLLNEEDVVKSEWEMYYEFTGPIDWTFGDRDVISIYYKDSSDGGRVEVTNIGPNGALEGFKLVGGWFGFGRPQIKVLHSGIT